MRASFLARRHSQVRRLMRMEKMEATTAVTEKVLLLEAGRVLNNDLLSFYVEKLIGDILDYCHRDEFPETLVYTVVDLIRKRLADEGQGAGDEFAGTRGPLAKIKQDDTEFTFAVNNVDATGCLSDLDFDSIKQKLNIYRRVVSHP